MKIQTTQAKTVVLSFLMLSTMVALFMYARATPSRSGPRTAAQVRQAYGQLPLSFEENRGQADESINFLARGPGYTLALSPTEAAFALSPPRSGGLPENGEKSVSRPDRSTDPSASLPPTVLRMNLVGANRDAGVAGLDPFEGKVNYLIGSDQTQWLTNIPTFGRVRYREVYPGIDLVYYGNQRQLEYDFVVAPGRDAEAIALEFAGTEAVEIEKETGDLLLRVGGNTVRQQKPLSYQEAGGTRRKVESRYAMKANGRVGFELGEYDRSAPLIIDPVLVYSTYVGGSDTDLARAIAVDPDGNAYITGYTQSLNFPTANAFQAAFNGMTGSFGNRDVFVTKINPAGNAFVYSTYFGGSGGEEARGIAADASGNAYVAGFTDSTNFPIANAVQATMGGTQDAFVTKLNPAGSALVYSTFLGGAGGIDGSNSSEFGEAIAVDSSGNAYVTGNTFSNNFPTVNPVQATFGEGSTDAFVTKINAAGDAFVYSTYLGGSGMVGSTQPETGFGIAADSAGNAYVTGETNSNTDFPLANAIQGTFGGGVSDAFVAKINPDGSAFVYSTYLGGNAQDAGEDIEADASGNAYVAGFTVSNNFPTANAFQGTFGGVQDAILTKLNADGSSFVYSTYLGGTGGEIAFGIAVDASSSVYLGGTTGSFNSFPVRNANQCTRNTGTDLFITKFNPAATELIYSTYLGGSGNDSGEGIALDPSNNAYMTGTTTSTDFPTVNPIQVGNGGGQDAFVVKFNDALPPSPCATTSPTPTPTPTATPTPTPTPTTTPTPTPTPSATPAQLLNISTRARVGTDDNVMIGGFIIRGNPNKPVVLRALGPSLTSMSVPANAVLLDPVLSLHGPNGELILQNDNWKDDQRPLIEGTIYQPTDDREAVIVATLMPAAYTAIVMGKERTTGIGVVEVYDNDSAVDSELANISTRGFVEDGDNLIIGGFILGGPNQGDRRVGIRALGPSLAAFGVPNSLQDPILELKNENGTTLLSNDNWQQTQASEITAAGLAPGDFRESAIIATLPVGQYSAVVQGKSGETGIALVEIYRLE